MQTQKPEEGTFCAPVSMATAFSLQICSSTPETREELEGFEPDFTIINACAETNAKWKEHNLNSEVAVAFNLEERVAVIFGTWYGVKTKKVSLV